MFSHIHHLLDVTNHLNGFGFALNWTKISLGLSEIKALGYYHSENGVLPFKDKVYFVDKFLPCTTIKSLCQFFRYGKSSKAVSKDCC